MLNGTFCECVCVSTITTLRFISVKIDVPILIPFLNIFKKSNRTKCVANEILTKRPIYSPISPTEATEKKCSWFRGSKKIIKAANQEDSLNGFGRWDSNYSKC